MVAVSRRLLVLVWLCSLPLITVRRAPVFATNVSLWTAAAAGSHKPRPWLNLASALIAAQRYPEAVVALRIGHDAALTRSVAEQRISDAYWTVLIAQEEAYTGSWTIARTYLARLTVREPTWPIAQEQCARLICAPSP